MKIRKFNYDFQVESLFRIRARYEIAIKIFLWFGKLLISHNFPKEATMIVQYHRGHRQ